MSKRKDEDLLKDIMEAIRRINIYVDKMKYSQFLDDLKTQDSVIRNLEIIGEAVNKLSEELKNRYSEIEWKDITGMRNRLIHDYFGVNYDVVWTIIQEDLPSLKNHVQFILKNLDKSAELK